MSFMTVILLILFYPILPIMYFMMRNEVKPRKNIVLGVTLARAVLNEPDVKDLTSRFVRELRNYTLLVAFLPFPVLFVQRSSIVMLILMNWLLLAIVAPYIPYTKYHRKLKTLKNEREWTLGTGQKTLIDTNAAVRNDIQRSDGLFVAPMVISALPFVYELAAGTGLEAQIYIRIGCGVFLLTTIMFYYLYRLVHRQRTEIIDEDSTYNTVLTRIRRTNWARFWLQAAWLNGLYSLVFWLGITGRVAMTLFLAATVLYTAFILWAALKAEFATRKMQYKLAAGSPTPLYMDEDDHWINGMFYYNPHDNRTLISNRVGMGMTMNMGKPAGKIIAGFALVCILAMPFLPIWIIAEEFTPLKIEVTDTALVITHLSEVARIDTADIESFELLEELPRSRKIVGSAFPDLRKGTFDADGLGRGRQYLNPQNPSFILLRTRQGYIIINMDDEVLDALSN